jgi:hypothetical protein
VTSPVSVEHPTNQPNFTVVDIGPVRLWFSYRTVVAFKVPGQGPVVCENAWSQTAVGKHLNHVEPAKRHRVRREVFERHLAEVMAALEAALEAGLSGWTLAPLPDDAYARPGHQRTRPPA